MILVQFWIMSSSFSVINRFVFSQYFFAFTTIGISSFYCKIITQIYSEFLVKVVQNTTVSVGGEGEVGQCTITLKALENIFYEIK